MSKKEDSEKLTDPPKKPINRPGAATPIEMANMLESIRSQKPRPEFTLR